MAQLVLAGLERAYDVFALALDAGDEHQEQDGETADQGHLEQVESLLLANGVMKLGGQRLRRSWHMLRGEDLGALLQLVPAQVRPGHQAQADGCQHQHRPGY